jgi:DNA gyrase subunit A
LQSAEPYMDGTLGKPTRYRTKSLPAAGALPAAEDVGEQLSLL